MKKWLLILLTVTVVNAGRTSEWSGSFILREPTNTIQKDPALQPATEKFTMAVLPDQRNRTVTFSLSGISSLGATTLRIYGINGRVVADLSGLVQNRAGRVVWRGPAVSNGLFFATLRNGANSKTIRFVLFK